MLRLTNVRSLVLILCFVLLSIGCGENTNREVTQTNSNPPKASPEASPNVSGAPRAKLNLNTASESELLGGIPGLGNKMVHEFEEYRPYRSIQQFRREIGKYVDPAKVAEYETYVFVPIDVNQSDALTLMQIPGLDQAEAEALIAGRPYASPEAFLAKVADKISAADLDVARRYLGAQ